MVTSALRWIGKADGHLELVDQRRLPGEFTWIECRAVEPLYEAIKTLAPGGLVSKTEYDGAGRPVVDYLTDGGGDSGGTWADAGNVEGDIVVNQV